MLIIALLLGLASSAKYWTKTNDWSDVLNWDVTPSRCDAVILPNKDYDYAVLLAEHARLNSLELPISGELVFSERSSLGFYSLNDCDSGIPSRNAYRPKEYRWSDPGNWYTSGSNTERGMEGVFSLADSDKIPCTTDTIIFNESAVFNVIVDSKERVGQIWIGGISMNSDSVAEYARTTSQLQFTANGGILVSGGTSCTDPAGCVCGNSLDCSATRCPNTYCVKPLTSKGICCRYCGAEIRFRPPSGFYLEGFKSRLSDFIQDITAEKRITTTVSVQEFDLYEKYIQITVSDSNTDVSFESAGYAGSKAALSIYDYIVKHASRSASDVIVELSHVQPYPKEGQMSEESTAFPAGVQPWVLYVVLGVSVALLIAIVVLLVRCRNRAVTNNNRRDRLRMDGASLPSTVDPRYKPCVPALNADIPTYEEVLMEDMITRGLDPAEHFRQPRSYTAISTTDTL